MKVDFKRGRPYHLYESKQQFPPGSANRWSSVRNSATNAWNFNNNGFCNNNNVRNALTARPVTKLRSTS
jgi:hypothetical protein